MCIPYLQVAFRHPQKSTPAGKLLDLSISGIWRCEILQCKQFVPIICMSPIEIAVWWKTIITMRLQ